MELWSVPVRQSPPTPLRGRRRYASIEARRDQLFAEIALLSEVYGPSMHSLQTARVLLTKWWSRGSWQTREELIKAADWLIRNERNRGMQPSA
jgi:hypothetical protein